MVSSKKEEIQRLTKQKEGIVHELRVANNKFTQIEKSLSKANSDKIKLESFVKNTKQLFSNVPKTIREAKEMKVFKWTGRVAKVVGTSIGAIIQIFPLACQILDYVDELNDWLNTAWAIIDKYPCEANEDGWNNIAIRCATWSYSSLSLANASIQSSIAACGLDATNEPHAWVASLVLDLYSWGCSFVNEKIKSNVPNDLRYETLQLKCKDDKCPICHKKPCECEKPCPTCGQKPCICCDYCHSYPCKCQRCHRCGKRVQQCSCKPCKKCGHIDCICKPEPTVDPIHDPSGFVYEGVFSNRLEGVIATAYYKEMVEDMYGDLHENIVKWNAEEYAQENPLFTDENGFYRWDVPQGLWQVKFEKDGYETTYSEWLPVPPPQLDVNITMKQNVQPNVKNARAYEDAVEVEFDKYMMPELLNTDNIIVMTGNKQVEGTIELLNEEVKYEGESETFASKIRFNATTPFEGTEVTLMVNNRVKSYAGIRMQDNYSQSFIIEQEIRKIVCDSSTVVGYGHSGAIPVTVLPASASAGKVLNVSSSSSMILTTDVTNIKLDENGCASIPVVGELLGTAALTFFIDGYDISATTIVNVEQIENVEIEAPKANIASGTTVEKGTKITLTCATEGATIYYTLDGSCPCDEASRLTYTEPIIVNETVTIKAMAVASDMTESDIVEFTYIVDEGVGIDDVTIDEHLKIYPIPVRDELNITAGGKIIKSVSLVSMSGSTVVSASKPVTHVNVDVSSLTSGIYIINVATEDKTYSRKIMKVE